MNILSQIEIVLIGTTHPGNIGSAARAMKTMGLSRLTLVNPACELDETTLAMASNADDILADAKIVGSLDEALIGESFILGSSARGRYLDWPVSSPRELAQEGIAALGANEISKVRILFGRERTGLLNEELQRCHAHLHIPANPAYSSLNLAAAVQLVAYEFRVAALENAGVSLHEGLKSQTEKSLDQDVLATDLELQQLYVHLEQALTSVGFVNPKAPKQVMNRLKRLLQRARCEHNEVEILRGMCSKILQAVSLAQKSSGIDS